MPSPLPSRHQTRGQQHRGFRLARTGRVLDEKKLRPLANGAFGGRGLHRTGRSRASQIERAVVRRGRRPGWHEALFFDSFRGLSQRIFPIRPRLEIAARSIANLEILRV